MNCRQHNMFGWKLRSHTIGFNRLRTKGGVRPAQGKATVEEC